MAGVEDRAREVCFQNQTAAGECGRDGQLLARGAHGQWPCQDALPFGWDTGCHGLRNVRIFQRILRTSLGRGGSGERKAGNEDNEFS